MQLRVAENMAAAIREQILNNTFTDGEGLPNQAQLASDFGVSPPSVREALRILEGEGLITVRRGKHGGSEVRRPNASSAAYAIGLALQGEGVTMRDIAAGILELEPMCTGFCAGRKDRKKVLIPKLRANLAACEAVVDDGPRFTHEARNFHEIVVSHTPIATLRLLVSSLVAVWSTQEETWAASMSEAGRYPGLDERQAVLSVHRKVSDAIASGDVEGVTRLARLHLEATQRLVLSQFGARVVDASSPSAVRGFRNLVNGSTRR